MDRQKYQFFMRNERTTERKLIYEGWFAEHDMEIFSIGLVIGLREHHKKAFVTVYEVIDGKSHLVRVQE